MKNEKKDNFNKLESEHLADLIFQFANCDFLALDAEDLTARELYKERQRVIFSQILHYLNRPEWSEIYCSDLYTKIYNKFAELQELKNVLVSKIKEQQEKK